MAKITVNHSEFEKTATAIETYISKHKKGMNSINGSVESMGSSWQGNDYKQVKKEWQEIKGTDSTSDRMLKTLGGYAEFLRYSEGMYKNAQADAINRANRLPK